MEIKNEQLESIRQAICFKKNYILALKKRLFLIKGNLSKKDEYERNEVEITVFQTLAMISVAQAFIDKKESELKEALMNFYLDMHEVEREFDKVLDDVRLLTENDSMYKGFIKSIDLNNINQNAAEKIKIYKDLKQLTYEVQLRG